MVRTKDVFKSYIGNGTVYRCSSWSVLSCSQPAHVLIHTTAPLAHSPTLLLWLWAAISRADLALHDELMSKVSRSVNSLLHTALTHSRTHALTAPHISRLLGATSPARRAAHRSPPSGLSLW